MPLVLTIDQALVATLKNTPSNQQKTLGTQPHFSDYQVQPLATSLRADIEYAMAVRKDFRDLSASEFNFSQEIIAGQSQTEELNYQVKAAKCAVNATTNELNSIRQKKEHEQSRRDKYQALNNSHYDGSTSEQIINLKKDITTLQYYGGTNEDHHATLRERGRRVADMTEKVEKTYQHRITVESAILRNTYESEAETIGHTYLAAVERVKEKENQFNSLERKLLLNEELLLRKKSAGQAGGAFDYARRISSTLTKYHHIKQLIINKSIAINNGLDRVLSPEFSATRPSTLPENIDLNTIEFLDAIDIWSIEVNTFLETLSHSERNDDHVAIIAIKDKNTNLAIEVLKENNSYLRGISAWVIEDNETLLRAAIQSPSQVTEKIEAIKHSSHAQRTIFGIQSLFNHNPNGKWNISIEKIHQPKAALTHVVLYFHCVRYS
ncbi:hypothetical protein [Methyloversatilis sp. XJ19-49]|uniref:hypothetical protein n=1 Tax=Methyloversatilis sp. XJ19-49 TaxID=2963429 RepID=UPI00211BA1F2|nr:hypothetical protein [Methyloversatilis sp. XJ19-49]MCQ9377952.1 hypothetical protein [Methyloversatilis sp. XJ19-49]